MPVRRVTAYALLKAFGLLEFELKKISEFMESDGRGNAKVAWPIFDAAVGRLPAATFLDQVSTATMGKILDGARNRPKFQKFEVVAGKNRAVFEPKNLPANNAEALVVATRRVRNNLFHGGKEDPLEERYPGDDQEWAVAACEVVERLLDLVRIGRICAP